MRIEAFAKRAERIAGTSSRNGKVSVIGETLQETDDPEIFTRFLLGQLYDDDERKTHVGAKTMYKAVAEATGLSESDVEALKSETGKVSTAVQRAFEESDVVDTTQTTFGESMGTTRQLDDVYEEVDKLPEASGDKDRIHILRELFESCDSPKEAKWVSYCILNDLAIGCSDATVKQAVVETFDVTREEVDDARAVCGNMPVVVRRLTGDGELPHAPVIGEPFDPMLAGDGDTDDLEGDWVAQTKYDGARILVHSDGEEIRIFSRNRNEVTESLPEITENIDPNREFIIDGEAVPFDPETGEPLPFQHVMERFNREHNVEAMRDEVRIEARFFDCINYKGNPIDNLPFSDRNAALEQVVEDAVPGAEDVAVAPGLRYYTNGIVGTVPLDRNIERAYQRALEDGHEGVIVKDVRSTYELGQREDTWRKTKPSQDIDLVVEDVAQGDGENANRLGRIFVRTSDGVSLGRVGIGFTEDERVKWDPVDGEESLVGSVVEIEAEELEETEEGYGLRFPRFVAVKRTQDRKDADALDRVESILN